MGLRSLKLTQFRCFEDAELEPVPGINLITGKNASGKTSLLEAIFLLGRGRSFRAARREAMIREGAERLRAVARLDEDRVLGLEVERGGWTARAAGQPVAQLSQLSDWLAVQVMDPDVHRLVQEGPGERRRYLDWATFHVKPGFLDAWRNYQRALRQRNAALKAGEPDASLALWERTLGAEGAALDAFRKDTVMALQPPVAEVAQLLLGTNVAIDYRPGQPAGQDLAEALAAHRNRDRKAGMTQLGPHRADLQLKIDDHRARGWVSRGQQKLLAAALVLGQARLLAPAFGDRGVLLVDDPAAELDRGRCEALLGLISDMPFQVFVTALDTEVLSGLEPERTFHVEQGRLRRVV
ncbi:MAG: DNA replication/repair protein RecF [Gammaproteobacteria bacterium]|jgi:DNA replication and repair protein RecF